MQGDKTGMTVVRGTLDEGYMHTDVIWSCTFLISNFHHFFWIMRNEFNIASQALARS